MVSDSGSFDAAVSGVGFDIGISIGKYPVHVHRQFFLFVSSHKLLSKKADTGMDKNLEIESK